MGTSAVYDIYYVHAEKFGQSGYATAFQDPELTRGNQAHHFWFYVQVGYESGELIAGAVNAVHETFIPLRPAGKSYQDLTLGYEGASLGAKLKAGSIDLASVATYTNSVLSPGSSQVSYWTYMHTAAWNAINQYPANPH